MITIGEKRSDRFFGNKVITHDTTPIACRLSDLSPPARLVDYPSNNGRLKPYSTMCGGNL